MSRHDIRQGVFVSTGRDTVFGNVMRHLYPFAVTLRRAG
jgi:hypothetical protein